MNADGVAIGDRIGELNDRLDKLYIVRNGIRPQMYMGANFTSVIILKDTSKINKDLLTFPLQFMYDLIYPYGEVIMYNGNSLKFLDLYNKHKKYKLNHMNGNPPFYSGIVHIDFDEINAGYERLTTKKTINLGININTIDDKENESLIQYIEYKDVEEAIFNTRMEIYNLTHRGDNIQDLRREIEELKKNCCEKLESKIDKVKINLSRVEGMVREVEPEKPVIMPIVRGPQFSRKFNNNNNNNKTLPISRAHVSRFINGSTPTSRSKSRPLKTNSPRRLSRRNSQSFSVENL
jgi:hypothetical protein